MLVDCERAHWKIEEVVRGLDEGRFTYEELMFDMALVRPDQVGEAIPAYWNHLERFEPGVTKLLHYTVVQTQPWRVRGNPLEDLWLAAYRDAVADGAIDRSQVIEAVRRGWVRDDLADECYWARAGSANGPLGRSPVQVELAALRAQHAELVERTNQHRGVGRRWLTRVVRLPQAIYRRWRSGR
jgi:hypothetical protein